jgi:HD superfamily phosphodiesterase
MKDISSKIWFPFPYKDIIVNDDIFNRPTIMHGVGHTYRVMLLSAILAHTLGWDDICHEVIWAAFFHDTQRVNDGEDELHGKAAVERTIPLYENTMKRFGLTNDNIEAIAFAVQLHSLPIDPPIDHPYYRTAILLKEADALDRLRMNGLDTSFLRFEARIKSTELSYDFFERLLNHVIHYRGAKYQSLINYTLLWLKTRDRTLQQYMRDCESKYDRVLVSEFYSTLHDASFYQSFLAICSTA